MRQPFNKFRSEIEWPTTKVVHVTNHDDVRKCPFCLADIVKPSKKHDGVEVLGGERGTPYFLVYEATMTPAYFHTVDRCASRRAAVDKVIAENAKKERQS